MASAQLQLVSNNQSWKLDRRTIEVGRAGLARARAALAAASTPSDAELYGGLFAVESSTLDLAEAVSSAETAEPAFGAEPFTDRQAA